MLKFLNAQTNKEQNIKKVSLYKLVFQQQIKAFTVVLCNENGMFLESWQREWDHLHHLTLLLNAELILKICKLNMCFAFEYALRNNA